MQAFPCMLGSNVVACSFCADAPATKHFGDTCFACYKCEQVLWATFDQEPFDYNANFAHTSTSSYSAAKKQKLDQQSAWTLADEKCKRFYPWVMEKWRQASAQSATTSAPRSVEKWAPY